MDDGSVVKQSRTEKSEGESSCEFLIVFSRFGCGYIIYKSLIPKARSIAMHHLAPQIDRINRQVVSAIFQTQNASPVAMVCCKRKQ
jgi:hypothetical protein